jgi:rSAM/selenodomain-associated transferase 1
MPASSAPAHRPEGQRLVVMAKAPVAGAVKTRLIPALGAQGAAQLAERLLERTLDAARGFDGAALELCCARDATHAAFRRAGVATSVQGEGDLGQRMARAFERALARSRAVVLIGTDAPALDAAYLRAAFRALESGAAVFGPALDGGYALVGLTRRAPALFERIDWGSSRVMAQTRERAREIGLALAELAPLADIDRPEDLAALGFAT